MRNKSYTPGEINDELLIDYIFKLLPADQEQALENFLEQSEEHAIVVDELLDYCLSNGLESKEALQRHLDELRQAFNFSPPSSNLGSSRTILYILSLAVFLLAALLVWQWIRLEKMKSQLKTQQEAQALLESQSKTLQKENIQLQEELLKLREQSETNGTTLKPLKDRTSSPIYAGLSDKERNKILKEFLEKSKTEYLREAGNSNMKWKRLLLSNRPAEALNTLESYIQNGKSVYGEHYFFAGVLSLYLPEDQGGNSRKAVKYLETAVQRDFADARPHLILAYLELDQWNKALEILNQYPETEYLLPQDVKAALSSRQK